MLRIFMNGLKNTYSLFDLQGTSMPTAKHADRPINVCPNKTGSSGCLEPVAFARAVE